MPRDSICGIGLVVVVVCALDHHLPGTEDLVIGFLFNRARQGSCLGMKIMMMVVGRRQVMNGQYHWKERTHVTIQGEFTVGIYRHAHKGSIRLDEIQSVE